MNDLGHSLLLDIRGVSDQTLRNDNAKLTWATILEKDSKNHQIVGQTNDASWMTSAIFFFLALGVSLIKH